jgi:hypothetical protein
MALFGVTLIAAGSGMAAYGANSFPLELFNQKLEMQAEMLFITEALVLMLLVIEALLLLELMPILLNILGT